MIVGCYDSFRALLVGLGQIGSGYDADSPFGFDQPHSSQKILTHARAPRAIQAFLSSPVSTLPRGVQQIQPTLWFSAYADLSSWKAQIQNNLLIW